MALTNEQLARLSELLDTSLSMPAMQRRAWLESLPEKDRPLVAGLRETLLADDPASATAGALDRMPRIETIGALEDGTIDRHAGERLGAYELLRPLGAGGMAEVWLARRADGAFEREVALKIPHMRGMPADMADRFARECHILASLETPNIARLYVPGSMPVAFPTSRWSTSRASRWWLGAMPASSIRQRAFDYSFGYWTR